ncbi:MAG: hypothetical protein ABL966_14750 [Acidimicrobiales bacterium]
MGHFPAQPASQSTLKVSCLFESDVDSVDFMVSSNFTIHDFDNAVYHNGAARTMTNSAAIAVGANNIQVGATNGATLSTWVNRAITGPGIAPRTFVTSITAGGQVNLSELTVAPACAINACTFKIDNAAGSRSIDTGTLSDVAGTSHLTTVAGVGTSASFSTAVNNSDVGLSVGGTRIPGGCTIATVVNANDATLSCVYNGSPTTFNGQVITIGGTALVTSARQADGALLDNALERVTVPNAIIAQSDLGLPVYGTNIAAGSVITVIVNAALGRITLGGCTGAPNCVTATSGPQVVRIGDPTGTAATDGDTGVSIGVQLDLSPTLVAGSQACSEEEPEGFQIVGTVYNPGNFQAPLFGSTPPAGARVLAQFLFDTATSSDFAGYIVQRGTLTPGDPVGTEHYDVVFPSLPVTAAVCEGVPTTSYDSPGLGQSITVLGQTASQARLTSGVGRPGTAQLRALKDSTVGYGSTVVLASNAGPVFTPTINFERTCNYPAFNEVKFTCGNG